MKHYEVDYDTRKNHWRVSEFYINGTIQRTPCQSKSEAIKLAKKIREEHANCPIKIFDMEGYYQRTI